MVVRARPAKAGGDQIEVVTWFDSLVVWENSESGRISPGTDGVIGGPYRGRLTPSGRYAADDVPFIPDELSAITDLAHAMRDFLPELPTTGLEVGRHWDDSAGTTILRLADSASLQRFAVTAKTIRSGTRTLGDTMPVQYQETDSEKGSILWDPQRGLVRWNRTIEAESSVPSGGYLKRPVRTDVKQRVTLERLSDPPEVCRGTP